MPLAWYSYPFITKFNENCTPPDSRWEEEERQIKRGSWLRTRQRLWQKQEHLNIWSQLHSRLSLQKLRPAHKRAFPEKALIIAATHTERWTSGVLDIGHCGENENGLSLEKGREYRVHAKAVKWVQAVSAVKYIPKPSHGSVAFYQHLWYYNTTSKLSTQPLSTRQRINGYDAMAIVFHLL